MAIDEALLHESNRTGAAFLRLYRWDPPCLSFGRNEPSLTRYDRAEVERRGLDLVRRPTGGRAVWHDQEVTYAVAAPILTFGTLRESYRTIHERLAAALRRLGVPALLAAHPSVRPADYPTACFSTPVGGEIIVAGKKVVGSAQVRHGAAFLQHGSILLGGSQDVIAAISRRPAAITQATTLAEVLRRSVTFDEVAAAIVGTWGGAVPSACPTVRQSDSFRSPGWTWRR